MTMISSQDDGNHLFTWAVSKLNPEIFSDPVWLRFGRQEKTLTTGNIDNLLSEVKNLQKHDPSNACQVLLICAVYQSLAGQRNEALRSIQHALALARRNSLAKEMIWSIWGACAICFQEGDYAHAARYSEHLQTLLGEQNEWIMADFIDAIKQALLQPVSVSTEEQTISSHDQPPRDLLSLTFNWLRHWGYSPEACEVDFKVDFGQQINKVRPHGSLQQSLPSVHHRRGAWQTLILMLKGKLSLQWAENDRHLVKEQPFFRRSILESLRLSPAGREIEHKIAQEVSHISRSPSSLPIKNLSPPDVVLPDHMAALTNEKGSGQSPTTIPVTVQMLGPFSITIQESPLKLPASRGLALLKYLLLHHKQDTPREVLMDIFWPDADPEAARNNLNVAMHGLRQTLRSHTDVVLIRFEDCAYGLSPNLEIWLDVEEFEKCIKTGQQLEAQKKPGSAMAEYEVATNLYQGDFLVENPYEGWTFLERERLRTTYLDTIDRLSQIDFNQERYTACVTLCQLILNRDLCREDAHCRLMQCYNRLGQGSLALRQYQICVEALRNELEVDPAPETTQHYERIRRHEWI